MPLIDLPLLLELVIAVMIVATLDHPTASRKAPTDVTSHWTPEHDLHAQRLLKLEARNLRKLG
ncbi:MAG: hypothetical protein RLZZ516_1095 [Cyanobacteriota bacterium]|jgi:hypothetical protein